MFTVTNPEFLMIISFLNFITMMLFFIYNKDDNRSFLLTGIVMFFMGFGSFFLSIFELWLWGVK